MTTVLVEKQVEDKIYKFYLDSLEFLRITDLEDKCGDFTQFYYGVRDMVNPNTHFTTLNKLGPSLLYIFLKTRGVLLILPDFLDLYQIKYYEFTTNLKKVLKIYTKFNVRDKKFIVKKFIATVLESFNLEERIYELALTLFDHFYPLVQCTKEEIVAAVICTLTAISFDLDKVSMRLICTRAGIPQSSLRKSIVGKIYPYLGIPSNFGLKASFELIKGKIRKKTSLEEIKTRTIEEEVEDLWRIGLSLKKITELVGLRKPQVVDVLESKMGDFRNYLIRYDITQQEIEKVCQLKIKGLSYREIATRIPRQLNLVKRIIEENLVDYAQYKYIPRKDRIKHTPLVNTKDYNNPKLVGQFYCELLKKIRLERSEKIPLSKLSYLLLHSEDRLKKNISKTCLYLSKAKIFRTKKTILGLTLALSFPQIPQLHVANLIGISVTAIRSNLKVKNLTVGSIAKHIDLAVKEKIDLESVFDYLEIIVTLIGQGKIPQVEPKILAKVLGKEQQVKENIRFITRKLREEGLYRDEGLILATAICTSCPSLNKKTIKQLVTGSVHRKIKSELIEGLQREVSAQEVFPNDQISLVEQLGNLVEERETDVLCAKCGKFVYLQIFQSNKKIFACKHC